MPLGLARPQHRRQRLGRGDDVGDRLAPGRAHQIVGVLALRQQREFQALAGLQPRQRQIDGAIGGAHAGAVAVEAEHRLVRHLPDEAELVLGQRRAERRHRRGKAGADHGDDVDITLDHDDGRAVMRRLARGEDVVERAALVEERRLRRVEILGRNVLLQRAAAEGDDAAAQIGDREDHAVAETVVRHRNVVAGDQQAGLDHVGHRHAVAAQMLLQRVALGRRRSRDGT